MSTSVERVLNNPYLLADIMRHVASIDKAPNVLSTLCVSRAFRNPHVISEALRSITYIYRPLRDRVTSDSVMSCIDVDHVSGVMERSELKIDGLLCEGELIKDAWGESFEVDKVYEDWRIEKIYFHSRVCMTVSEKCTSFCDRCTGSCDRWYIVIIRQLGAYSVKLEPYDSDGVYDKEVVGLRISHIALVKLWNSAKAIKSQPDSLVTGRRYYIYHFHICVCLVYFLSFSHCNVLHPGSIGHRTSTCHTPDCNIQ